jgi:NAD(P)-dependent dehydrogenase (short-subunit alcohol dehydrogenase family)
MPSEAVRWAGARFAGVGIFDRRVAIVTGAAGGIGRASALAFAREGASVVVADIDVEHGNETVALIGAAGGQAHFIRTDVAHATEVANMVSETVRTFGRLDIAHSNAGVAGVNVPIGELPDPGRGPTRTCRRGTVPRGRTRRR